MIDLVGKWRANAGDTTIDLAVGEESQFAWKAVQTGKPPIELKSQLESTSDALVLESKDQGSCPAPASRWGRISGSLC